MKTIEPDLNKLWKRIKPKTYKFVKKEPAKLTLQQFDDDFADYYDVGKDVFVIYAGIKGADFEISTNAEIKDYNGRAHDCYLWAVCCLPEKSCYKIEYKKRIKNVYIKSN